MLYNGGHGYEWLTTPCSRTELVFFAAGVLWIYHAIDAHVSNVGGIYSAPEIDLTNTNAYLAMVMTTVPGHTMELGQLQS